jgi:hypothetical protein
MPLGQELNGIVREFSRAIEDPVQQHAEGSQTGGEDRRSARAREFLEVHEEAVDRQEPGVPTGFYEGHFLAELRQYLRRPGPAGSRLLGERHGARYHILEAGGKGETLVGQGVYLTIQRGSA